MFFEKACGKSGEKVGAKLFLLRDILFMPKEVRECSVKSKRIISDQRHAGGT